MGNWKDPLANCTKNCSGKKGCGYKFTWADKDRCFKCNIVLPKEIQFKPNPYQGWVALAWANKFKSQQPPKHQPYWSKDQQAGWKEPDGELDKVASLEQAKKFMFLAGWTEEDQA
eukprot:3635577-Heterocapsa_arctica.AAC.1